MATTEEDGTAQPPSKRLRRDARGRGRAYEDAAPAGAAAAVERRRRRHHSDGLYVSATAGARDDDELPEAEATTLARFEGAPQLRPISPLVPAWYPRAVERRRMRRRVIHHEELPEADAATRARLPQTRPIPLPIAVIRVGEMEWAVTGGAEECDYDKAQASSSTSSVMRGQQGAVTGPPVPVHGVMDIFLVQPRDRGVPPPRFQTIRSVPWGYWVDELRLWLAPKLHTYAYAPDSWSWESVMGEPAYGGQGACIIYALATCIRAQNCIAFERRYGAGTFPYKLSDVRMKYLIDACLAAGVLKPGGGSDAFEVLNLMRDQDLWVRTQEVEGWERCNLRCSSFGLLNVEGCINPPPLAVALFIRVHGPIMGTLDACDPDYLLTEYNVYRGNSLGKSRVHHAVVCAGHRRREHGEIHIRILDNMKRQGPWRWIFFGAFSSFYVMEVEPLDRAVVQHQHNNT